MENYFQSVSRQIAEQIKLISQEISQSGMKGESGGKLIRQFLKKYLPKKYSLTQGKVVDFAGNESRQPCEVYLNSNGDGTLLFFLLILVSICGLNLKARQPDYSLYLTFYNKLTSKERLSDGWLFH